MASKKPIEIKRQNDLLQIRFSDSTVKNIPFAQIRENCSCAVCLELKVRLSAAQPYYQRAIRPVSIEAVGNYALQIAWEDGHRSIAAFDRLEALAV